MSTIFFNGKIYTGELPFASAFAVDNGHFTAVGTDEDVLAGRNSSDLLIDLSGRFVCAGFNDSHMHLVNFGQTLSAAPLAKHTDSLSAVIDCMKAHLAENPPRAGQWLTGRGWNQDYFTDVKSMPDRFDLDAVSTEIPIVITRACGHCCAANSKALALAGIDGSTISPEGGSIGTVCFVNGVDFCVLRAISDLADGSSAGSFGEFEQETADLSASILRKLIEG